MDLQFCLHPKFKVAWIGDVKVKINIDGGCYER